ncbi:MAG: UDP-N-acetylmuramate--L-alanine ligase, partial [Coriobacteriales bacterium]|nr:UDP-N-acetylmuramate--L-alanine ligase [Coriobacteriales bacterium]
MQQIERVHFIGIAGSGMSGLAIMAKAQGLRVSGSDRQTSKYLDAVLAAGIPVSLSQSAENVADPDIDIVVVSTAIHADNPELLAARQRGLVIWPRAQMLAWLGQGRQTWAVAGTHGKTTTSSMLASALLKLGCDPSFVIGGVLNEYQTTAHLGLGQVLVIEADESDESFMMFSPQLMILTNIEADHMDHYHSLAEIEAAFARFMTTLDSDGLIVYCCDDQRLDRLIRISGRPAVSYGFSPAADYRCLTDSAPGFTVRLADGQQVSLELPASPGQHNVLNATAVLAALIECGFTPAAAAQALSGFQGVKRRFELIGEARGVQVVDDYGHHPTEIKATLAAARQLGYQHVHLLFQPHRFTRTSELFDDFVEAFHDADSLALLDIYTAGEDPISGVSSRALAAQINALHPASQACLLSREAAPAYLARLADAGDLILTLGAGDVTLLAPLILEELAHTSDLSAPNLDTTDSGAPAPHVSDTSNPSFNAQEPNYSASSTPESSSLESSTPDTQSALIFEAYCELEGTLRGTVQLNEPMARHTSFRIGGPAGLYIECASLADLNNTLKVIKQYQLAWTVIGKGTNLLVSDRGFAGAIITLGREFKVYQFPDQRSGQDNQELTEELPRETQTPANTADILVAGAGVQLGNLVQNAFKNGYSGLEFAVGIP